MRQTESTRGGRRNETVGALANPPSIATENADGLRAALGRALQALRDRDAKVGIVEASLQRAQRDIDDLRRELDHQRRSLDATHRDARDLFHAYCDALPGRRLGGRFDIIQRIGTGGSGVVFHAVDRKVHRDVALKLIHLGHRARLASGESCSDGLRHLSHPNVAAPLETGMAGDGVQYVVLELLRGRTLRDVLQFYGRLDLDQALHVAHGVSLGLAEANRWDVVHRDIKPSNVFVARSGPVEQHGAIVKILDFGIATVCEGSVVDRGPVAGTPSYVAPERIRHQPYDHRADVYSLGVLIHEMLGSPLLHPGELTRGWKAPTLAELVPGVPRAVSDIVARCLDQDPEKRPTANEVASVLGESLRYPSGLAGLLDSPQVVVPSNRDTTLQSIEQEGTAPRRDTVPEIEVLLTEPVTRR